jgi:hypothetical protein
MKKKAKSSSTKKYPERKISKIGKTFIFKARFGREYAMCLDLLGIEVTYVLLGFLALSIRII